MTLPDTSVTTALPLVVLHGDEMAQVAFDEVLNRFIRKRTRVALSEHDLSAKNRLKTKGEAVKAAMEDVKRTGAGVKNAGVTVTQAQKEALLAELAAEGARPEEPLPAAAYKSPNGAIRKAIAGNIVREDIPFRSLQRRRPEWLNRRIDVPVPSQGAAFAPAFKAQGQGTAIVTLIPKDGSPAQELHRREVGAGDPVQAAYVDAAALLADARAAFRLGLNSGRDVFVALKDTVVPGYDGVMKTLLSALFDAEFKEAFAGAGLTCRHALVDAQAAAILINPPEACVWLAPDAGTALYLRAAVEGLKKQGYQGHLSSPAVARMSSGGADQYGSFQCAVPLDGEITLSLCGTEVLRLPVTQGSPFMLMHNEKKAIVDWAASVLADAARAGEEVLFGLDPAQPYDNIFIEYVEEAARTFPADAPTRRIVPAAELAEIMLCRPPVKARYALKNLDGDVLSDVAAAMGGSLATAGSAISGADDVKLFEAPHGTAPDLYKRYLESGKKEALFNPTALIWATAEALATRARRDGSTAAADYAERLKQALLRTVDAGIVTPDLKGTLKPGTEPRYTDLHGFLDAVEHELDACRHKEEAA